LDWTEVDTWIRGHLDTWTVHLDLDTWTLGYVDCPPGLGYLSTWTWILVHLDLGTVHLDLGAVHLDVHLDLGTVHLDLGAVHLDVHLDVHLSTWTSTCPLFASLSGRPPVHFLRPLVDTTTQHQNHLLNFIL
jgi:hypothetical protein